MVEIASTMKHKSGGGFWYGFNITAVILILFFAIATPLFSAFSPFAHTVTLGAVAQSEPQIFTPTIIAIDLTNESMAPLNAVEFELFYDPSALMLTEIASLPTLCEERFLISNTIDNTKGVALFQCGTISPFSSEEGTVAHIHAIPLRLGTTSLSFGERTHVLAHDGMGTDATGQVHGLVFTLR